MHSKGVSVFAGLMLTLGYAGMVNQVMSGLVVVAAQRTLGLRAEPGPEVVQKALRDFYVEFELRARMVEGDQWFAVLSRLHGAIQDVLNENNVQIMSPHFEAQPAQAVVIPKIGWAPAPAVPLV